VRIFYKLRNKLPDEILKQLYFAFVHCHITYAAEIYINTYDSYLGKLNKLNNKILRILQNKNRCYPITLLYRNFNTLPPSKLHEQQILLFYTNFSITLTNCQLYLKTILCLIAQCIITTLEAITNYT